MSLRTICLFVAVSAFAGTCGVMPVKPVTPVGCKDLKAECVCDARGNNCHWEWLCVK